MKPPSSNGKVRTLPLALDLTSTLKLGSTIPFAEIFTIRSPFRTLTVLYGTSTTIELPLESLGIK